MQVGLIQTFSDDLALRKYTKFLPTATASFLITKSKSLSRGDYTTLVRKLVCSCLSVSTVKLSAS